MTELYTQAAPVGDWRAAPECARDYDAIIVLGCPNEDDGSPAFCQRSRVELALRFHEAGYASTFITTGGAVQNQWVEAETLRDLLVQAGVSSSDVLVEPQAEHTDENLYFSTRIMQREGFERALVVSEAGHLGLVAVCDANCCVKLGRLTLFEFPVLDQTLKAGHYELLPPAEAVGESECSHLIDNTAMCINLPSRRACADNFQL